MRCNLALVQPESCRFSDDATVEKLYDNLDFQRAVQAYLLAIPAVNQAAMRKALLQWGPANTTMPIWEDRVYPRTIGLTFNTSTPYAWMWIDLHNGPLVVEVPPGVLGAVNDHWYRWVVDVGLTGPDKGKGENISFCRPAMRALCPTDTSSRAHNHMRCFWRGAHFPTKRVT